MKLVADKLTRRCSSHHRMMDSRQNPESARILIRVFGQWRLSPNASCACTWKCTASRLPSPRIEACSSGTSFRRWVGLPSVRSGAGSLRRCITGFGTGCAPPMRRSEPYRACSGVQRRGSSFPRTESFASIRASARLAPTVGPSFTVGRTTCNRTVASVEHPLNHPCTSCYCRSRPGRESITRAREPRASPRERDSSQGIGVFARAELDRRSKT